MTRQFDLKSYLDEIYSEFPESNHQPIIGLTANYSDLDATIRSAYYKQIVKAGGTSYYSTDSRQKCYNKHPRTY